MNIFDFSDFFEIITFPSGETHVRLLENKIPKSDYYIINRCIIWKDVMHLISANEILSRNHIKVNWVIPYKPFARQDRVTGTGHGFETKILDKILWDAGILPIYLDVHSNNCSLNFLFPKYKEVFQKTFINYLRYYEHIIRFVQVVPDKGALEKLSPVNKKNCIVCEKDRDPITGRLSNFRVLPFENILDGLLIPAALTDKLVLVDDICDGGGTFFALADILKPIIEIHDLKLELVVTHGIFSKGFDDLSKVFSKIHFTNSFKENYENLPSNVIVYDIKDILNFWTTDK